MTTGSWKALQFWEIIQLDDDRMTLTIAGREIARDEGTLRNALASALRSTPAYHSALEWAYHQNLQQVDSHELGAYWHEHFKSALGAETDKAIARACGAFLRIAEAAGLGTYVLGRKGQPTRLEVDRAALQSFVEGVDHAGSQSPAAGAQQVDSIDEGWAEASETDGGPDDTEVRQNRTPGNSDRSNGSDNHLRDGAQRDQATLRVFISHGTNMDLVEQVGTMLELADVPFEIAVNEETTAIPVPQKVLASMRRCNAGVVIVSVDDEDAQSPAVNENVLIEIGAAFVLYDQRVVLVWDKRLAVPSNLQGLYRCEFEGAELGWGSGVKLMKAIRSFRSA